MLELTQKYPSYQQFRLQLDKNGAGFGGYTNSLTTVYTLSCATFEWQRVLKLILLAIAKPVFPKENFEHELNIVKEELLRQESHGSLLHNALYTRLGYAGYRSQQRGLQSLENISLEDIQRYWQKMYSAANLRFVIAGNLAADRQCLVELFEESGLAVGGQQPAWPAEKLKGFKQPLCLDKPEAQNFYFIFCSLAQQPLPFSDKIVIFILAGLLSSGYNSRIFGEATAQGLLYSAGTTFYSHTKTSALFQISNQVRSESAQQLFELIGRQLRDVLNGRLTQKELVAIQQRYIAYYHMDVQTPSDLIGGYWGYLQDYIIDDRIIDFAAWPELIKQVTLKRIQSCLQKMFAEKQFALALLGPDVSRLADELKKALGKF